MMGTHRESGSSCIRGRRSSNGLAMNVKLLFVRLPDSTSTRVIIQHSQTVFPGNITCWLRYFADYTFQLNRAARFVKFVYGFQTSFIHNFNSWHCVGSGNENESRKQTLNFYYLSCHGRKIYRRLHRL